MKLSVLSLIIGSAAAFAPVRISKAPTSLNADEAAVAEAPVEAPVEEAAAVETTPAVATPVERLTIDATKELGALSPLGFFDPAGRAGDDPTKADAVEFAELRYIELKHGRCAMLATVGYLVTAAGVRFPGAEDIPYGFAALDAVPGMVWAQFFATVFAMELVNGRLTMNGEDFTGDAEFPGDFRNGGDRFGWNKKSDEWKLKKRTIEINNGRAAMMGILGIMVHDKLGNLSDILPLN